MHLLKKFNQYMLENHPLTWHSKFIQLMLAGVLFWLVSYLCGYLMVDLEVIQKHTVSRYYTRSNFVSFHVIYCLIVICIWAIFFYKNNAIKSFYPLQRLYLVRLFLQLFVAFCLLVSAHYPFTAGAYAKVRSILPKETFEKDIDQVNLGSAFLIDESNHFRYHFTQHKGYKALGYDYVTFDQESKKWDDTYEYYYYPELVNEKYVSPRLLHRNFVTENDPAVTVIAGKKYLFFKAYTKYTSEDSCSSLRIIDDFHKLELENLHEFAFANYNSTGVNPLGGNYGIYFTQKQIPKIHRWTAENRRDSIEKAIAGLVAVCKKYGIEQNLKPALIATYLQAKDYSDLESFVQNYGAQERDFAGRYPEEYAIIRKYSNGKQLLPEDAFNLVYAMEEQEYIYYDTQRLNNVVTNYRDSQHMAVFTEVLVVLAIAFFMAWLFLFFEFANIVSLLISIPIGGVVAILVGVALVYVNLFIMGPRYESYDSYENYDYHQGEKVSAAVVFVVCLVILLLMLFGLYRKRFNKKVLNVLVNLSYIIAPMFINLFLITLNLFSGHYEYRRCDESNYIYNFSFLLQPGPMILFAFAGVFAIFPLIIKWRAREE